MRTLQRHSCFCGSCLPCKEHQKDLWGTDLPDNVLAILVTMDRAEQSRMHLVCRQWRRAVCSNMTAMVPKALDASHTEHMRQFFPGIRSLTLNTVQFSGNTALCLATVTQLQALELHRCTFTEPEDLVVLGALPGLTSLLLEDVLGPQGSHTDELLGMLTGLDTLIIRQGTSMMQLPELKHLSSLTGLCKLHIASKLHRLPPPGFSSLSTLSLLRSLELERLGVTDATLQSLSSLHALTQLSMPDSFRVTSQGLRHLSQLTNLRGLDVSAPSVHREEPLTDAGVANLAGMTQMEVLNLAGHHLLTSEGLWFIGGMPNLRSLDLTGVQLWTNGAGFLLGLTALQDLSLATTELTSPGHAASLRHLTGLTRLQLHNNALADPKDVADMVASMPHLQLLSVSFTTLDSKAVVHIARSLRHLSALLFDGCPVSTLGVVQCLRVSHCKLRCWSKERRDLPRWMNLMDLILVATPFPHCRKLRMLHQPEQTMTLTAATALGVTLFFLLYLGLLMVFFTAVFLFPIVALSSIMVIVTLSLLGARVTLTSVKGIYRQLEKCTGFFMLGVHHNSGAH